MLENYKQLKNGVITQIEKNPINYGFEYSNKYNNYGELASRISHLRLGYLLGNVKGTTPTSLLDVGYGNGAFLKVASQVIPDCYGNDTTNEYPLPNGVKFTNSIFDRHYDVITMFDVLEHFDDIYDIAKLQCNYLYVSMPWCHYFSDDWFESWKHRRPDEHLFHFNDTSLINFMKEVGFKCLSISNLEDCVRTPIDMHNNILSGFFSRQYK